MIIVKNTCLVCNDSWNVNLKNDKMLYSVCESCSYDGECHSVLPDDDLSEYKK